MPTVETEPAEGKRGRGRPRKDPEALEKKRKSGLTLVGIIPHWLGYTDLKCLIKQYRGAMFDERKFALWVDQGAVPSYYDGDLKTNSPGVRRRKYVWEEVRAWIDSQMKPVPAKGIVVNGEFQPLQGRP